MLVGLEVDQVFWYTKKVGSLLETTSEKLASTSLMTVGVYCVIVIWIVTVLTEASIIKLLKL